MISLVMPCYNEADVLPLAYDALVAAAAGCQDPCEFILVDDGSRDGTWSIISQLAQRDQRVRGLRLARNFGQQAALGAGLKQAQGDCVIVMDADLQDPPSLVPQMLQKWQQGFDVVYAQRRRRDGESWFKKATSRWFYRVQERLTTFPIPRDAGDFCLMDARVVGQLLEFSEQNLFWRGLRSWCGFRETSILFDRPERAAGSTKYDLRRMLRLASSMLLSFSDLPLKLPQYAGTAGLLLTILAAAISLGTTLWGASDSGWRMSAASLGLFFLGSVQLLCLGLLGEYLQRIYNEVRRRPRWLVDQTVNCNEQSVVSFRVPKAIHLRDSSIHAQTIDAA